MNDKIVLTVTGHRPNKLGGYLPELDDLQLTIAKRYIKRINPSKVITGMALGWDTAVAKTCVELEIPFIAAVPFKGQEKGWRLPDIYQYRYLLDQAKKVVIVCEGDYAPYKMQTRNVWMINRCDEILSLYNGDNFGGTFNAINYAVNKNKIIINAYNSYKRLCKINNYKL